MDATLNVEQSIEILQEIMEVKSKCDTFGRIFKLPSYLVNLIHHQYSDPQDRLLQVIEDLCRQIDPKPTWRNIIGALRHPLLQYYKLALEIERKFSGIGWYSTTFFVIKY